MGCRARFGQLPASESNSQRKRRISSMGALLGPTRARQRIDLSEETEALLSRMLEELVASRKRTQQRRRCASLTRHSAGASGDRGSFGDDEPPQRKARNRTSVEHLWPGMPEDRPTRASGRAHEARGRPQVRSPPPLERPYVAVASTRTARQTLSSVAAAFSECAG